MKAFSEPFVRRDLLLILGMTPIAWRLLAVGLISPLTPSEGSPAPKDLVLFYALPVAALFTAPRKSRNRAARTIFIGEAILILAIGAYFIYPIF